MKSYYLNRCVRCWNCFEATYRGNVCGDCSTITPGVPHFKEGRFLLKGTKDESWMSKAHEKEISSGVGIPKGNGKFALGRIENGKVKEKPPRNYKQ